MSEEQTHTNELDDSDNIQFKGAYVQDGKQLRMKTKEEDQDTIAKPVRFRSKIRSRQPSVMAETLMRT